MKTNYLVNGVVNNMIQAALHRGGGQVAVLVTFSRCTEYVITLGARQRSPDTSEMHERAPSPRETSALRGWKVRLLQVASRFMHITLCLMLIR